MDRRKAWPLVLGALVMGGSVAGCAYGNTPAATVAPTVRASPAGSSAGAGARVIELEETAALEITQGGLPVNALDVTPGETVRFVITNTAGFDHDFFIGPDDRLASNQVDGLPGLPTWRDGAPRDFEWTVPADVTELAFGCTLRGHYPRMKGTFAASEAIPSEAGPSG